MVQTLLFAQGYTDMWYNPFSMYQTLDSLLQLISYKRYLEWTLVQWRLSSIYLFLVHTGTMSYPKKTRFQSVPIAALCLYNVQRENLVFKKSLCRWGYLFHEIPCTCFTVGYIHLLLGKVCLPIILFKTSSKNTLMWL